LANFRRAARHYNLAMKSAALLAVITISALCSAPAGAAAPGGGSGGGGSGGGGRGGFGGRGASPPQQQQQSQSGDQNSNKKANQQVNVQSLQSLNVSDPYQHAARPSFSLPKLSPSGRRLAMIARLPDSLTTLLVVDIASGRVTPFGRVEVPYMLGVADYGWTSDDQLVMWLDIDTTQFADDAQPSAVYIAEWDLRTRKITQRQQPIRGDNDLYEPFAISSDLVRAPWGSDGHALISECSHAGMGGAKQRTRTLDSGFTFAQQDARPPNTILCTLLDWDVAKNRARSVAQPFYGYPVRFFASSTGAHIKAEGRDAEGRLVFGEWDAERKRWARQTPADQSLLLAETDSTEEDYSALWQVVHRLLPQDLEPVGRVVQASETGRPVGVQLTTPEQTLTAFGQTLAAADAQLTLGLEQTPAAPGNRVTWESVTDSLDLAVVTVDGADHPGAYLLWRAQNAAPLWVTARRALDADELATTTLHTDWLDPGLPVAVTTPLHAQPSRGLVLMPVIASDAAATSLLNRFSLLAQWLASQGLTVAQVPVPLPGTAPGQLSGADWRNQVRLRLGEAREQTLSHLELDRAQPLCLVGRNADAYAVLAAVAEDQFFSCAVAINPQLDPQLLQPYARVTSVDRNWYVNGDNTLLNGWRRLYGGHRPDGSGLPEGAPDSWHWRADTNLMLAYEMYDETLRPFALSAGGLTRVVKKAGGRVTVYDAHTDITRPDRWLTTFYGELVNFIAPPVDQRKSPDGQVTILPVQPSTP
jgi:hypothetical protein